MDKFKALSFGNISIKTLCTLLFCCGVVSAALGAYKIGYNIYTLNTYKKAVHLMEGRYMFAEVNNLPLGILVGMFIFIVGIVGVRVLCEIVYIILQYFKSNTKT